MATRHSTTHRHTANGKPSPEYAAWMMIIQRCRNPKCHAYRNYGGRGIRVCDRWLKFVNFIEDVGLRPSDSHSIDRIDNDGNYEPNNVRWATMKEQCRNRRTNHNITHNGRTMCMRDWAVEKGMSHELLWWRIRHWKDVAKALETPVEPRKPRCS